MSIKLINKCGPCMAESTEDGTIVALQTLNKTGEPEKAHLWMVTVTRECKSPSGARLYPVVSSYHVLAQDEENAIAQVKDNAFPEMSFVPIAVGDELKCVATRIPFQIRGWGRQVF